MRMSSGGLLDRLKKGVVIGDGGFCHALEKRGYVKAGVWTPECTVLHPDAGTDASCSYASHNFVIQSHHALLQCCSFTATSCATVLTSCKRSTSTRTTARCRTLRNGLANLCRRFVDKLNTTNMYFSCTVSYSCERFQAREINLAAFKLAKQAAEEGDCLVSISITEPMSYRRGASEEEVKTELTTSTQVFRGWGLQAGLRHLRSKISENIK